MIEESRLRTIDPHDPQEGIIAEATEILAKGGLIAYPTETVYGLGADPRLEQSVTALFRIKKRNRDLAIPLIAADIVQVEGCIAPLTPLARQLADSFWPGPLTLVMGVGKNVGPLLTGADSSVAVRVPDHMVARNLARTLGYPVTATSANVSGFPPAKNAQEVIKALGDDLSLTLDGGQTGDCPSTVVDVRCANPKLLRAGVVQWDRVLQSIA